jgi:hypothetical protein
MTSNPEGPELGMIAIHQMGHFRGWRWQKGRSSTKWGIFVDGDGRRAVRPPNGAFSWMAMAEGPFIHQMGRFRGWRRRTGRDWRAKVAEAMDY